MAEYYVISENYRGLNVTHTELLEGKAWVKYEKCCETSEFVELQAIKNGKAETIAQSWTTF